MQEVRVCHPMWRILSLRAKKETDGVCRNPKSLSGKAEVFLSGSLYAYGIGRKAEHVGNIFSHCLNIWCETRCFCYYSCIDVSNLPSFFAYQLSSSQKEQTAINAGILCITVGEVLSYVTKCQSAKQRIANGVYKHICVRVSQKPLFMLYINSAEYELSAFDESVTVKTETYSHFFSSLSFAKAFLSCRNFNGICVCKVRLGKIKESGEGGHSLAPHSLER